MTTTIVTRDDVVDAARGWIGTPYQHQQRTRGVAVDCAGLVIGVARQLGLVAPDFDIGGYDRLPDGRTLVASCEQHMRRIAQAEMQPGDVVAIRFDAAPQHFGILVDYRHGANVLALVHATARYGGVVEHRLLFSNATPRGMKFVGAYVLPGIE